MTEAVFSRRFDGLGTDGAPARLGIMGGTFDPIHIGHLVCAEQVREAFQLDAVVFVPAGSPAFKQDCAVTSGEERLAMCRLACGRNPHFDVSDMEVARAGVTYTADTVRVLREHYPRNVELFFITGADAILSIARWHESAELAELVRFVAVTRPGYAVTDEFKAELAALGAYRVDYLEVTALAVSSSDLRRRAREGGSLRYLVPDAVADYIGKRGLYAEDAPAASGAGECVDALSEAFFQARAAELSGRVSARRLAHIEGVVRMAGRLAERYGVDVRKARIAALLHDWDKAFDDAGIRARARELGLVDLLDPWVVEQMPQVLHAHTAAAALAREFPCIPADVLHAVDVHTTASASMSPLDMVVYVADAIEESRKFGSIDELRALVGAVELEELFFRTYAYWMFLLLERGKPMHPDTIRIWNEYALRNRARKGR